MFLKLVKRTNTKKEFAKVVIEIDSKKTLIIMILYNSLKVSMKTFLYTDINFVINDELIYYVKNKLRLCIFKIMKKNVFKLTHDVNFHFD